MNIVTTPGLTELISKTKGEVSRLDGRCDNLQSIGRYLALWDCTTGKPTTNPTTLPYTYKAGDYYRIGNCAISDSTLYKHSIHITSTWYSSTNHYADFVFVSTSSTAYTADTLYQAMQEAGYTTTATRHLATGKWGSDDVIGIYPQNTSGDDAFRLCYLLEPGVVDWKASSKSQTTISDTVTVLANYKPTGTTYDDVASTTVETNVIAVGDVYFYDGTSWSLQINHSADVYTKTESDALFATKATTYTKTEVDTALAPKIEATNSALSTAMPVDANTLEGHAANYFATASSVNSKSTVSVAATGTSTDEIQYITIDGMEKKIAGGGGGSQLYAHYIVVESTSAWNADGHVSVAFTLITNDSTPFTITTVRDYIRDNFPDQYYISCSASVYYSGRQNPAFKLRYVSSMTGLHLNYLLNSDSPIISVSPSNCTATDTVIQL